jgi:hypothetical protein
MQLMLQNGTQVRLGNADEFDADQCSTGEVNAMQAKVVEVTDLDLLALCLM